MCNWQRFRSRDDFHRKQIFYVVETICVQNPKVMA
ncbi:unnamed protein product [Tenebrio molitor]|nr:unnamed protein product [Tenebrio molitor]